MRDLGRPLNKRRSERGSIDFDLPEPIIEFDAEGRCRASPRRAHLGQPAD
jgi:ribonuclease R